MNEAHGAPEKPSRRKLPVIKTLAGAFLVPWWSRRAFVYALLFPALAWIAMRGAWILSERHLPTWSSWILWPLHGVLFAVFAVRCHRLVLLGSVEGAPDSPFGWSRRETRFLFWLIGCYLVSVLAWMLISYLVVLASNLLGFIPGIAAADLLVHLQKIQWLVTTYVLARLSLVLPAVALDHPASLIWAWRISAGNGLRLTIVVGGLPWILDLALDYAYLAEAGDVGWLLLLALGVVIVAFEVSALSLCYRELSDEPERRETPAVTATWLKRPWGWKVWTALALGTLMALPTLLALALRSDCEVTSVRTETAPGGTHQARLERRSCGANQPTVEIWLAQGRTAQQLFQSAAVVTVRGEKHPVEPSWKWLDSSHLEIVFPEVVNQDERRPQRDWNAGDVGGVFVTYRQTLLRPTTGGKE